MEITEEEINTVIQEIQKAFPGKFVTYEFKLHERTNAIIGKRIPKIIVEKEHHIIIYDPIK